PARGRHRGAVAGLRPAGLPALRGPPARAGRRPADHPHLRPAALLPDPGAPARSGLEGAAMRLLAVGCSHRTTPVAVRERLAFPGDALPRALEQLAARFDGEAVILSTCNRVELYLGQPLDRPPTDSVPLNADGAAEFLAEFHGLPVGEV